MDSNILRVLLVEDDAGDAMLVERTLQRCRQAFALRQCELLEDALGSLADGSFDVVLLDLSLPDSFGLSGLDRVRERAPDIPIVVLTGLADDDLALQSLEQGEPDYLVKGNTTADLLERTLRYAIQRQQIQAENRRLLKTMEALARQDPLTGVLNRHSFAETLESEWQRAKRHRRTLACVVLDIDFFKRVNDNYGHATGDRMLQAVARTLCETSRSSDAIGRLGGEEFCVLLPETTEDDAITWAERIRHKISQLVIPADGDQIRVSVSLGVAVNSIDLAKPQTMLDQADEAMFVAKQLGRDQVISFSRLRGWGREASAEIWHEITARQLMTPLEVALSPRQSIADAIRVLHLGSTDTLPVLSESGDLVGVIGHDDILAATLTSGDLNQSIREVMQTQLVRFAPEAPARQVCEFLCRAAVRQVFVSIDDGVVGIVRRTDFVGLLGSSLDDHRDPSPAGTPSAQPPAPPPSLAADPISAAT